MSGLSTLEIGSYILKKEYRNTISLVRVGGIDKDGMAINRWMIKGPGSSCLSKSGEWDIEPLPSSRSDHYIEKHRWTDPEEAYSFWLAYKGKYNQERST